MIIDLHGLVLCFIKSGAVSVTIDFDKAFLFLGGTHNETHIIGDNTGIVICIHFYFKVIIAL